ncbi:Uncharacterized protein TCM_043118 [Theobroma cacao]|uniref:Cdc6 C-terminal domain-containing protein n=1 Tax=Theobroma cacao TaxID=3641 RepID=A0A061FMR4_THECC|nr:Uncharacterized protein TCM_043118 [Theobroma cacao]
MMRYGCLVVLEVMLISYATTFMLGKPMVVTCPSVSTLKIKSYQYFKRDTSIYCLSAISITTLCQSKKSQLPLEVCRRLFTFVGVTLVQLNKSYIDICKSTLIPLVEILEFSSMCKVLNDQGLFNLGQSRIDKSKRVTLQVDEAGISFAL